MLFSSPSFFVFFALYFCFHLITPKQYRVYLIICGSTIFYAWWKVAYAYCGVLWITRAAEPKARRGKAAQSRPATVLAYVLFFPHLIAGPILRPAELIPQLEHPGRAIVYRFSVPIAIFTLGLLKKLVFADQIADVVDAIYADGAVVTGP